MKIKYKIFVSLCFALVIMFSGCSDKFEYNNIRKILISNEWEVSTYINYSQNQTTEFRPVVYTFEDSGKLIKAYEDNDTVISEWVLSEDANYLTIGSNTFRITDISKKVLSLRYGEIEIFYVAH